MFLIDDILLAPGRALLFIFKKIHETAEDELFDEGPITAQLTELYMMLETGKITEQEFNERETELLDRLDAIREYKETHYTYDDEELDPDLEDSVLTDTASDEDESEEAPENHLKKV